MPRSSADPSLREPSGLSLHTIRRATQGAPEMGACARPARSLPRSRRGRETQALDHRPGTRRSSRTPPLPCWCPGRSHPPTPTHTLDALTGLHASLSWESGRLARTRPGLLPLRKLTLGTTLDQALLPDPRQEAKAVRAPWLKYAELQWPKAQAKNSDVAAAGRGSLASEECPS